MECPRRVNPSIFSSTVPFVPTQAIHLASTRPTRSYVGWEQAGCHTSDGGGLSLVSSVLPGYVHCTVCLISGGAMPASMYSLLTSVAFKHPVIRALYVLSCNGPEKFI